MSLFEILGKNIPNESITTRSMSNDNKPGPGKKQCQCGLYLGVRTKICKNCGYDFNTKKKVEIPELILPPPIYVYEHLRTDTWEKEQADKILLRKENLAEKQNEFHYAPTSWRPLCYTVEEVLERRGNPKTLTLKEDLNRIIIKCIKTDNYFKADNPKFGLLQQLIVVEVINI